MTGLPSTPKLGKLVALLSSDKDGERLAAIAAIDRTLQSAGLDFHDLARAVDGVEIHARAPAGIPLIDAPSRWNELSHFEQVAWLQALLRVDWLTATEREFVADAETALRCTHRWPRGHQVRKINKLIAIATAKGVRP
jgi:hypothetical protein